MPDYQMWLFVAGDNAKMARLVDDLHHLCQSAMGSDNYSLEVIDVLKDPERAESSHVLATPTLIRDTPKPRVYLIGDLSHQESVLEALDLKLHSPLAPSNPPSTTSSIANQASSITSTNITQDS